MVTKINALATIKDKVLNQQIMNKARSKPSWINNVCTGQTPIFNHSFINPFVFPGTNCISLIRQIRI